MLVPFTAVLPVAKHSVWAGLSWGCSQRVCKDGTSPYFVTVTLPFGVRASHSFCSVSVPCWGPGREGVVEPGGEGLRHSVPLPAQKHEVPRFCLSGWGVVRSSSTHTARPEPQHEGACFVCLGCTQPPAAAPKGVAT